MIRFAYAIEELPADQRSGISAALRHAAGNALAVAVQTESH